MKRLEENVPYLGSGSDAGIEALARLAAAGVEIGFDPEAMGGGDDPLADYFGKVEAAGEDQANKFLQWADEQIQRGAKTAKIQGTDISLTDYRERLNEIRSRKQQIIPKFSDDSDILPSRSFSEEVKALRVARKLDEETQRVREEAAARKMLDLGFVSRELTQLFDIPAAKESVSLLLSVRAPELITELANYFQGPETDGLGKTREYDGFSFLQEDTLLRVDKDVPRIAVGTAASLKVLTLNVNELLPAVTDSLPVWLGGAEVIENKEGKKGADERVSVFVQCSQVRRERRKIERQVILTGVNPFTKREGDEYVDKFTRGVTIKTALMKDNALHVCISGENSYDDIPNRKRSMSISMPGDVTYVRNSMGLSKKSVSPRELSEPKPSLLRQLLVEVLDELTA